MKIHLSRAGSPLTIVSLEELKSGYATGQFLPTDLYWHEGMGGWQSLNTFEELREVQPDSSVPAASLEAPFSPPALTPETTPDLPSSSPTPAWEQREELGMPQAAAQTISQMLLRPSEVFPHFQTTGGFGKPLTFYLLLGFLGILATTIYDVIFQLLNIGTASTPTLPEKTENIPTNVQNILNFIDNFGMAPGIIGIIFAMIFGVIFLTIGIFLSSGITHILLMIFGGANKPYEATFRVYAYSFGAAFVFLFVPVCGNLIYSLWGITLCVIGLTRVHQTETWRTILAILTPVILCCLGAIVIGVTLFAGINSFSP